ncbi:MAG: prephenate dehydrogenase/arogenate dehydrogenase family protein, partial [Pyrinomonadaceae bacterium]
MTEIGIIGFGQFGQFMAQHLAPFFDVTVCDNADRQTEAANIGVEWSAFEITSNKKIVIFAVPLNSFAEVLKRAAPHLKSEALGLDVCSVKMKPIELMIECLPKTVEIIGTH